VEPRRVDVLVSGRVQGVGFRPFVYRLAVELGLSGWVKNERGGVRVAAEGEPAALDRFVHRLRSEAPPHAAIDDVRATSGELIGVAGFAIHPSDSEGAAGVHVPPDVMPCPECLRDVLDPSNRRYRYPFTHCASCGPRYTIIRAMPYDRSNTTMARFPMCAACRAEYDDPSDRRFHAEAIACPACGPQLAAWDNDGRVESTGYDAVAAAAAAIRNGRIVAVKGVGGFHLLAEATNDSAVRELRRRKHRPDKPFAVLCESLDAVEAWCDVAEPERLLLQSVEGPIVLVRARSSAVAPSVAPGNPNLGVMLPPSPLHLLVARAVKAPVVATSGNRSDEPICIEERDAVERFRGIADLLLVHDRAIERRVDDSVVRVIGDDAVVLRVGRGYAPLVIPVARSEVSTLAVGGGQKNTVALRTSEAVALSQHIGNLSAADTRAVHRRTASDLAGLHGVTPAVTRCDRHPDDAAARDSASFGQPVVGIQHHHAHVLACRAEHGLDGPVLGVAWDGTGYGLDGTIWGGEFLIVDDGSWRRVGHLRTFRLPGGEQAIREPRRAALGVLVELFGERVATRDDLPPLASWSASERAVLARMASRAVNAPLTSSVGRLFDAVSSLIGIRQTATFEGQAAMDLEFAAEKGHIPPMSRPEQNPPVPPFEKGGMGGFDSWGERGDLGSTGEPYPISVLEHDNILVVDWEPTVRAILDDVGRGVVVSVMARRFHEALVEAIVTVAERVGEPRIALTGGCFQNRYLTERATARLTASGLTVYRHRRVPPNDGGLALGQAVAYAGTNPIPPIPPLEKGGAGGFRSLP
ncbi:MAG TPA: carbamoyltransferase HypF, partial [Nitrospiria bacterium]|nr:carbamoyltransferase HypF [Nitrospiria bacterium]